MDEQIYMTAGQMREIDREATEDYGIPSSVLMENAGKAVADEAMRLFKGGKIAVFCGFGNNGGDGFVAARYLALKKYDIAVYIAGKPKSFGRDTNANLEKLLELGLRPVFISQREEIGRLFEDGTKPSLIIDAIFGIGINGELDDFFVELINRMNSLNATVIAADLPSGLDADTGSPLGAAVRAAVTVTFGYPKLGFKNIAAKDFIGEVIVSDIGLADKPSTPRGTDGEVSYKTIKLKEGKKGRLEPDHPWIFKGKFTKPDPSIKPGEIVTLIGADNRPVGVGYYNPKSSISIRLLSFKKDVIDETFFAEKIKIAAEKRKGAIQRTDASRAVFSEADGLPGLIVDIYGDTAVFQALTLGIDRLKPVIVKAIKESLGPKHIYEKSVSPFRKMEDLNDVKKWWGPAGPGRVRIFEQDAKFIVDIENGHKTGFYLDQRASRAALGNIARGKTVLDLFCYTGAFSIIAALSGASKALGIDIKEDWIGLAEENASLNGVSDKTQFIKGDVFGVLQKIAGTAEKYDIIVLDPPSFLKNRSSVVSASKGYAQLNRLAMSIVSEGGVLATFSCSHNMPNETFSGILKESAARANKKISILKRCHQAIDHPVARPVPETEYLKGYFLKVSAA